MLRDHRQAAEYKLAIAGGTAFATAALMRMLLQDVRYALRMLGKTPGVTAVILLTLALGIGANTAIFSFAYGVWLRPLPYPHSERLAMVLAGDGSFGPVPLTSWSGLAEFGDWQEQNRVFEEMAVFTLGRASLTGSGAPDQLSIAQVTPRFFETLGVSPAVGRTFATEAARPGRADVVMLGARFWQQRFGSDPDVVGKLITLDGRPFTVVGVMPESFRFPEDIGLSGPGGRRFRSPIDVWTGRMPQLTGHNGLALQMVARLKEQVTMEQAQAEVATIARRLAAASPDEEERNAWVVPLHTYLAGDVRPLLLRLLGAVGFVLLIACANVASLLLARATSRQKEVAVRTALGSGRLRLVRQFLTESALLGVIGGLGGFLAAVWAVELLLALVPEGTLPRLSEVGINLPVLMFTLLTSLGTGVLFGLMPALHATRTDVNVALKEAGATQTRPARLLSGLVVAEVALALVLLAGAGLLIKSFVRLTNVDPGFRPHNVLTLSVTPPETAYKALGQIQTFHTRALERLARLPGVDAAGAVNCLPFGGALLRGDFTVEGMELPSGLGWAVKSAVSPDYFRAMGISVVQGRPFNDRDTVQAQRVAIITESLARRVWQGQNPIGKRVSIGFGTEEDPYPWLTIVGIVREVKQGALSDEEGAPSIYVPLHQTPMSGLLSQITFVVHGSFDPTSLAPVMRREMQAIDPNLPVARMITLDGLLAASVAEDRFRTVLLTGFAGLALALVATGILGVLAYAVTQRAREIGLRMALGARNTDIVRLVLRQAVLTTIVGVAIGVPAAAALTRLLASYLFDVKPNDAATFLAASALLLVVAIVAALVPARRAAGVDPLVVLRSE